MTIENGASATNDTAVPAAIEADDDTTNAAQNDAAEVDENGDPVAKPVDETEELEWDGKKWALPKEAAATFKPALLRQEDYTRKTQALSEERKAFNTEREAFIAATTEENEARASVHALSKSVKAFDEFFAKPDWALQQSQDPVTAQQNLIQYQDLKRQLDAASGTMWQISQKRLSELQRQRATQAEHAQAEIPKLIAGWTPELDTKLGAYATAQGIPSQEYSEIALRNPKAVSILHKAFLYDESQAKAAKAAKLAANNEAVPAVEIGAKAPAGTKDPSRMSTAEWMKWRANQLNKKRG